MKPTPMRLAAAALLAFSLCAAPARAGTPDEHFVLTAALVQKVKAAAKDLGSLKPQSEAEEAEDDRHRKDGELPVEYFIKSMETRPGVKARLAKQGLTPKEFGLAYYALVHGGMVLGMEAAVGRKTAAETMAKFTKEQQANIALLRKLGPGAYAID